VAYGYGGTCCRYLCFYRAALSGIETGSRGDPLYRLHLLFNRIYITIYNYAEVKALRKGWKSGTEGV